MAAADHQLQMLQGTQIVQRVALRHDEIGALARLDGTGDVPHPGQLGVAQGGSVEGKLVAHAAVLVEIAQLPPEVVLSDVRAAHIVAQAHRNAVGKGGLGALHHAVKNDLAVVLVFFRCAGDDRIEQCIGQCRRDGGAHKCAALLVQFHRFFVHFCAVLNGIHAVFQRHLHAFGRFGVRRHGIAQLVGLVADGLDHFRRHFQLAGGAFFGGVQHAAGDHQLDKVHPLGAGLGELGQGLAVVVGRHGHRACHVAARHRDALVGGKDTGCQQLAGCGIIPAAGVKIGNAAHGADGGHAAQQFQLCIAAHQPVGHRPGQGIAQDLAHQRCIVAGLCTGFAVARQVHMQVDQAGHHIIAVQVDDLIPVQIGALVRQRGDGTVLAQQHLVGLGFHMLGAVQQNAVDVGSLHWWFPRFYTTAVVFSSSIARSCPGCNRAHKKGRQRFCPCLPCCS